MMTHKDAAQAQLRAQQIVDEAGLADARAARRPDSVFAGAYAEAKRREARAATVTAVAQARWASWGVR